jgi:hypothetical protein
VERRLLDYLYLQVSRGLLRTICLGVIGVVVVIRHQIVNPFLERPFRAGFDLLADYRAVDARDAKMLETRRGRSGRRYPNWEICGVECVVYSI